MNRSQTGYLNNRNRAEAIVTILDYCERKNDQMKPVYADKDSPLLDRILSNSYQYFSYHFIYDLILLLYIMLFYSIHLLILTNYLSSLHSSLTLVILGLY